MALESKIPLTPDILQRESADVVNNVLAATRKITEEDEKAKLGQRPRSVYAPKSGYEAPTEPEPPQELVDAVSKLQAPQSSQEPEAATPAKPPRKLTVFEANDLQQAEVRMLMNRELESSLLKQIWLMEQALAMTRTELEGVRAVIRGNEATIRMHGDT